MLACSRWNLWVLILDSLSNARAILLGQLCLSFCGRWGSSEWSKFPLWQVGIYKLLHAKKKGKKKGKKKNGSVGLENSDAISADETAALEADSVIEAADLKLKMAKAKVKKFVKQQKLRLVGKLVQQANGDEPWGPAIQVKVQDLECIFLWK